MSRRPVAARLPDTTVVVGWDNPLSTFFAQVDRVQDKADRRDPVLFWIGAERGEVTSANVLASAIEPYATLSAEDIGRLRDDRADCADRGPSPLQRAMLARLGGGS